MIEFLKDPNKLHRLITIILITHSVAEAKGVDFVFKVDKFIAITHY